MLQNIQNFRLCTRALKLTLLGLALTVASGCGIGPKHSKSLTIDPEFSPYVASFEAEAAEAGQALKIDDLHMTFGRVDLEGETLGRGVCEFAEGETPTIKISEEAWLESTDAQREELVFHELGHCILGLRHVTGITDDGIPQSIMTPVEISSAIYKQNRAYYVQTLFAK